MFYNSTLHDIKKRVFVLICHIEFHFKLNPNLYPFSYPGPRKAGTGIYYMLRGEQFVSWHRHKSDVLFFWHKGAAVRVTGLILLYGCPCWETSFSLVTGIPSMHRKVDIQF